MELYRAVLLATAFVSAPCLAQDGESGDDPAAADVAELGAEPSRCVSTSRIDRTDIIDDQTIVFELRGGAVLVNSLPRRCPGLARADRFMYEIRNSRLCDTDTITVLEQFGTRLSRGFTCRLGKYYPSNKDAVALLKEAAESGGASSPVTVTPVEPPAESSDAASSGDAEPPGTTEPEPRD
jgi:hypothetical protein